MNGNGIGSDGKLRRKHIRGCSAIKWISQFTNLGVERKHISNEFGGIDYRIIEDTRENNSNERNNGGITC